MNLIIRISGKSVAIWNIEADTAVEIVVNGKSILGIIENEHDGVMFGHWPDGESWDSLTDLLGGGR